MSVVELNSKNFNDVVNTDKPVIIDFWAPWCGPCRMQAPIIEELAEDFEDEVVVAKLNVDENMELSSYFSVSSIPTLLIIKDKKVIDKRVGLTSKDKLTGILNSINAR